MEPARVGEPAIGLHEEHPHALQLGRDPIDIAAQDRREVGIDHCRVATPDQLHQRADLVRHGDLRKALGPRQCRHPRFVIRMPVPMHEYDCDRRVPFLAHPPQVGADLVLVKGHEDLAAGADALIDFHHFAVQHFRQDDMPVENARPVLVGDAQRIAKAARDEQDRALSFALEQGIGRDGRPHLDGLDVRGGNRRARRHAEQLADALDRGVCIAIGVVRQELVREQGAVGAARDNVGKRAAAIYPELPAG